MRAHLVAAVCALTLLAAAPAGAATRYAAVGGLASGACDALAAACTLPYALTTAVNGDRVLVAPGTYPVGQGLGGIGKDITVEGDAALARPVIVGSAIASSDPAVLVNGGPGARPVLRHLDIRQASTTGYALELAAATLATAEDLLISTASTTGEAVRLFGTVLLRDSVVRAAPGGVGVTSGDVGDTNAQLRNVTVTGGAIGSRTAGQVGATSVVTTIRNSILLGSSEGLLATGVPAHVGVVLVDHSLFGVPVVQANGSLDQTGGGNLAAAPLLVDLPGGNLRPLAGSPTIDAGVSDTFTGARDPDGHARSLGAAPDVGAYEFVPPAPPPSPAGPSGTPVPTADTTPPAITLSRLPARTTVPGLRSGLLVGVATDEPASLKASLSARRGRKGTFIAKVRKPVTVTLGRATAPLGAGTRVLVLKTGPKVGRATRFKATVTVTATDVAGNTARVSKTISIGVGPLRKR